MIIEHLLFWQYIFILSPFQHFAGVCEHPMEWIIFFLLLKLSGAIFAFLYKRETSTGQVSTLQSLHKTCLEEERKEKKKRKKENRKTVRKEKKRKEGQKEKREKKKEKGQKGKQE